MTGSYESLQKRVDNTMELTSVCRSEWCRELESEIGWLEDEMWSSCRAEGSCSSKEVMDLKNKIHKSIKNLSPNIHM